MREAVIIFAVGLAMVAAGVALIYRPAGLIASGIALMAVGWLVARGVRAGA